MYNFWSIYYYIIYMFKRCRAFNTQTLPSAIFLSCLCMSVGLHCDNVLLRSIYIYVECLLQTRLEETQKLYMLVLRGVLNTYPFRSSST